MSIKCNFNVKGQMIRRLTCKSQTKYSTCSSTWSDSAVRQNEDVELLRQSIGVDFFRLNLYLVWTHLGKHPVFLYRLLSDKDFISPRILQNRVGLLPKLHELLTCSSCVWHQQWHKRGWTRNWKTREDRNQPGQGCKTLNSLNGGIVQMKTHEKQYISTPTANLYLF